MATYSACTAALHVYPESPLRRGIGATKYEVGGRLEEKAWRYSFHFAALSWTWMLSAVHNRIGIDGSVGRSVGRSVNL